MPATGRNVRQFSENTQIPPAKPRNWMQHQEASEKCPKAGAKMPVSGHNVRHSPENIQRLPREARKVDVAPGS